MPGAPPPAKKSNALMWVGLGCGGLFLLSAIGGGVAVYMAKRATENAIAAASSSLAAPLTPPVAGGDPAAPAAGAAGTCARAVECCIKIIQKTSPGAQNEAACAGLKQLPEANCALPLTTYQKSAQLLGVKCD
jgi:hypothetical protein